MKVVLTRLSDDGKQTLGELNVYSKIQKLYSCKTLELSDKDNKTNVSCIPRGTYLVKRYYSNRFGRAFMLKDVPKRTNIAIHIGNFYSDIRGCIIVGESYYDLNKDDALDLISSRKAMEQLLKVLPDTFYLQII